MASGAHALYCISWTLPTVVIYQGNREKKARGAHVLYSPSKLAPIGDWIVCRDGEERHVVQGVDR